MLRRHTFYISPSSLVLMFLALGSLGNEQPKLAAASTHGAVIVKALDFDRPDQGPKTKIYFSTSKSEDGMRLVDYIFEQMVRIGLDMNLPGASEELNPALTSNDHALLVLEKLQDLGFQIVGYSVMGNYYTWSLTTSFNKLKLRK